MRKLIKFVTLVIATFLLIVSTVNAQPYTLLPSTFSKLSPLNNTIKQPISPLLKWTPSIGVITYSYCIDTSNNNICDTSWISTGKRTSIRLNNLTYGKVYYWQIRAKNLTGYRYANGKLNWWHFKVIPDPRTPFERCQQSGIGVRYSVQVWGDVTEELIYLDNDSGGTEMFYTTGNWCKTYTNFEYNDWLYISAMITEPFPSTGDIQCRIYRGNEILAEANGNGSFGFVSCSYWEYKPQGEK